MRTTINGRALSVGVTDGRKALVAYYNTERASWRRCCEHDGIDPQRAFVVFSDDNPFRVFHDRAAMMLQEAIAAYQAGGYLPLPTKA